ncbi:Permease of the drug/metabolite transporter (DMT) superfamily [Roseivivax halotolerans]|jgi:drug/metabolite transporter (DMT)-like permease|uniref:Permease of the drug/metabolite transporter (DMT) superfamily n=1 Tax=Roseivivax halotolerans TaxID=93684 RepID=A0A1I5V4R7_9RHOB|nr:MULTISPECIES: DMT family transporter [Roseivivax]QFT64822.1 Riboflavin transporter [Roseivivax sp. THAF30]SFQ02509.1 Permease of the drug/metabolite transporter (DMT) superfamily [Roseivivax halotolerans]
MGPNARGAVFALTGFAVFATHDLIVKVLGGAYNPIQILFYSVLFGFPLVALMLIRDATPGHLRPEHPWWVALRTLAAVVTGSAAFYAFANLPLAQVYTIIFAAPLFITILAIPILGERVRLRRWAAVIVGLCGVLVVLRPGSTDLTLAHMAALVAAFGSALASIISRKIGQDERTAVLILYPMLGNFAVMFALLPFVHVPMPVGDLALNAGLAVLGFVAAALMIEAYRAGEAVIVAPMQYSQIIWATLFGALFFDEGLDGPTLVGASIIIASGLYIVVREGRANASENRPVSSTRTRFETGTWPRIDALIRLARKRSKTRG